MKIILPVCFLFYLCASTFAQTSNEFVPKNEYRAEMKKLSDGIVLNKKSLNETKKLALKVNHVSDSLVSVMSQNQSKLSEMNDSLVRTSRSVQTIQSTLDARQNASKTRVVLTVALIFILLGLSFLLLILFRRRADRANEKVLLELVTLKSELNANLDQLKAAIAKMNVDLSASTISLEERIHKVDQRSNEIRSLAEKASMEFSTDLGKFREDYDIFRKVSEEKRNEVYSSLQKENKELSSTVTKEIGNIKVLLQNLSPGKENVKGKT
jgi:hypothetical protein